MKSEEIFHQKTDYKKIIIRYFKYKYYFVAAVLFAMVVAFLINRYGSKVYSNFSTILINKEQRNSFLSSDDIFQSGLFSGIESVENELALFTSYAMISRAVQEMNLEVSYYLSENILPFDFIRLEKETELYISTPIRVIFDQTHVQPVNVKFYLEHINDSVFRLLANDVEVSCYDYVANNEVRRLDTLQVAGIYKYGEKIVSPDYSFTVFLEDRNSRFIEEKNKLFFTFNNLIQLSLMYAGALSVTNTTPTSSVVSILLSGSHPYKVTDFLNTLTYVYLDENLQKKNQTAFNTIKFIDARISDISDSLSYAESRLQSFRSQNQVMNLSFQGEKLFEKMNEFENERVDIIMQQRYFDYIRDYFNNNDDVSDLMAPSSMEVNDPTLNALIGELMELNNQRMNYIENNPKNLFLKDLDIQISNIKKTILENIDYNYKKSEIALEEIDSRVDKLNSQITYLPKTERELIGMERQFKLNDAIYTFLLQKRAEAQIARASSQPDYEIVNKAQYFTSKTISPKTTMNYIIAMFLGLFIPFSVFLVRDFFNDKITEISEIEELTDLPIVGHILQNTTKSKTIIRDYPKSPIADSFRTVRTNLQFYSHGNDAMTILITSTISGEGKSFCSINLASVYALLGKKTVLLGFDLRRPALYSDFNLKNDKGISSYLINNATLDDIIQSTPYDNLDLISAGQIPPNPMELIDSTRTAAFFEELRKKYDYIIIDSAPLAAVSDSLLLFKYSDINILVVRHNYTIKDAFKMNLKNIQSKGLDKISILVNDVKISSNSYGYSYQSKYYSNVPVKGLNNKIAQTFRKKVV